MTENTDTMETLEISVPQKEYRPTVEKYLREGWWFVGAFSRSQEEDIATYTICFVRPRRKKNT